jgi:(S)-2-hydroxyglutarate dehydrogenase
MAAYDVAVIGAGIVGLASALRLLERHPHLRLIVVEKELAIGLHQTGHNSGVIHRGVYYTPGSSKATLCVEGSAALIDFCRRHGVDVRPVGKVVVALEEAELPALQELYRRGNQNGVPDLELIGPERLRELEPQAAGIRALHSPHTSVVDFGAVARAYARIITSAGGHILLGHRVQALHTARDAVTIETQLTSITSRTAIACAGLQSDRLAEMSESGASKRLRIVPFRGDYYTLSPERRGLVRGLIYPVPDPRFPFLGVHFTVRHDGDVWLGPNAVLAFRREGYGRFTISPRDVADTFRFPGFWRFAARHWRVGAAELWRDYVRSGFLKALQRYVPSVADADILPGASGVRAQAVAIDGTLVDDFLISTLGRTLHVRNAPSPAATSSLAIGAWIADRAEAELGVGQ